MGASPWKFANPTPHAFSFSDMSFIDNNTGLAVNPGGLGSNGGIMRTTDGGRNWQFVPLKYVTSSNSVALANFNDIHFVTPSVAYAVGSGGLMIKSTDGGITWSRVTTPLTALGRTINGLHFLNKDTGYIGGAAINTTNTTNINDAPKVYVTRDGGATWDSLVTPFRPQQNNVTLSGFNQSEIQRIHFVNDSVGYVSGSCGQVLPTNSAILWKIEKNVVQDYSIHRTKFGFTTTNYQPCTQTYKGVVGINDSLVLISSFNNGMVIRVKTGKNDSTANALPAIYGAYEKGTYEVVVWLGATTTPFPASLANNVAGQMQQLKKAGGKIFLTAGNSIVYSPDNGTTWAYTKPHPTTVNYSHWGFNAIDITPNGRIVIGSFSGLSYDSLPGAPGWQTIYKNQRPLFFGFSDMDWADCNNGVVVGSSGTIMKTSDGGRTWVNNSNPVFEAALIGMAYVQYHRVNSMFFVAGTSIYKSADQGTTNDVLFTEPVGVLNGFTMVGEDRAFAIGQRFSPATQRAVIFRSLNANAAAPTWDTVKTFPLGTLAPTLRNIKFANQDTGYVSASRGKVYRTTDGGATWNDISPDTTAPGNSTANYTALSVINGRTLYVGGSSRKLFRSTDAGATWTDLTLAIPPLPTPITSFTSIGNILMNDINNGYIQSGNILMRTSDGWSEWTYDLAPQGMVNISLYPKIPGPIENKKLYATTVTAGSSVNSTQTATLLEYGNAALYSMTTSEISSNASCSNPNGGSITITASGGIAPYSYSIDGSTFQSSNTFTGLTQGTKTITIKDAGCALVTKTVTITFTDNLALTASNDTVVCAGAPVQLQATASNPSATYSWSPAAGLSSTIISNPVATPTGNTTYTVTATLNGCTKTETVNIGIKPSPIINAGPDKTIVIGDQVQLSGSANGAVSISWSPAATLINANTFTPYAKPATTTTYTLTVVNSQNCSSTDQATVTVLPNCIKVLEAFTPNGDGVNEKWTVSTGDLCTKQITVTVLNRYGNVVYKNDNYQNDWTGTYNGKPLADGTYYYMVTYTTITGRGGAVQGNLTILR